MHSIEASIVLFITFLCIVFLLQSTITLHSLIKERSEKEYGREIESHRLGKDKDFYKVECYTRFVSVVEDLLRKEEESKVNPEP